MEQNYSLLFCQFLLKISKVLFRSVKTNAHFHYLMKLRSKTYERGCTDQTQESLWSAILYIYAIITTTALRRIAL